MSSVPDVYKNVIWAKDFIKFVFISEIPEGFIKNIDINFTADKHILGFFTPNKMDKESKDMLILMAFNLTLSGRILYKNETKLEDLIYLLKSLYELSLTYEHELTDNSRNRITKEKLLIHMFYVCCYVFKGYVGKNISQDFVFQNCFFFDDVRLSSNKKKWDQHFSITDLAIEFSFEKMKLVKITTSENLGKPFHNDNEGKITTGGEADIYLYKSSFFEKPIILKKSKRN
jgi:hypothetical protein